jgi:hypothetical protein
MIVELTVSAVTTVGFGVLALLEYFARDTKGASAAPNLRSNQPVYILLGLCALLGNLSVWAPAVFGW